jgi:hypothetical protein
MRYHRGRYDPAASSVRLALRAARRGLRRLCAAQLPAGPAAAGGRARPDARIHADFDYETGSHRRQHAGAGGAGAAQGRVPGLRARDAGLPAQPGPAGALRQRLPAHRAAAGQDRGWSAATPRMPGCRCTCPAKTGPAPGTDLDPTNDRAPGEDYVTLAIGRDFSDVSPIRGVIHGGAHHTLRVAVTVAPLPETRRMPQNPTIADPIPRNPMSVYDKLKELGITLPPVATPGRGLRAVRAHRQPGVPLRPHRQADGKAWVGQLGKTMQTEEGKAGRARHRRRPDGHAARRRRRPEQGQAHRQGDEPGELHARVHRAAPGDQRRQRAVRPGVRRQGRACAQRLRRGADPDGRLRRDRADRRGRATTASTWSSATSSPA